VKFERICPQCKARLSYKRKYTRDEADKKGRLCKSCSMQKYKIPSSKLIRNCPSCESEIRYKEKWSLDQAILKKTQCRSCSKRDTIPPKYADLSVKAQLNMSKFWFHKNSRPKNADMRKDKTYTDIYGKEKSEKIKKELSERVRTKEENIKRSVSCKRSGCGLKNKGRRCSDKNRKKFRLLMIERLKATNTDFHPGYNKRACLFFDQLMVLTGSTIRHALNGGELNIEELGYWVDGYDKENNIVYEYDEKRHYDIYGNLKEKDRIKEKEIKKYLNCSFQRVNYPDQCHPKRKKK